MYGRTVGTSTLLWGITCSACYYVECSSVYAHLAYLAHDSKFGDWDSKKKVGYHRLRHGLRHPQYKVIHLQVLPVNSTKEV